MNTWYSLSQVHDTYESFSALPLRVTKPVSNLVLYEIPCLRTHPHTLLHMQQNSLTPTIGLHDPTPPIKYGIHVPMGGDVAMLKDALVAKGIGGVGMLPVHPFAYLQRIYPSTESKL